MVSGNGSHPRKGQLHNSHHFVCHRTYLALLTMIPLYCFVVDVAVLHPSGLQCELLLVISVILSYYLWGSLFADCYVIVSELIDKLLLAVSQISCRSLHFDTRILFQPRIGCNIYLLSASSDLFRSLSLPNSPLLFCTKSCFGKGIFLIAKSGVVQQWSHGKICDNEPTSIELVVAYETKKRYSASVCIFTFSYFLPI